MPRESHGQNPWERKESDKTDLILSHFNSGYIPPYQIFMIKNKISVKKPHKYVFCVLLGQHNETLQEFSVLPPARHQGHWVTGGRTVLRDTGRWGDTKVSQTRLHETSRTGKPTERWEDRGGGGGRGVGELFSETPSLKSVVMVVRPRSTCSVQHPRFHLRQAGYLRASFAV